MAGGARPGGDAPGGILDLLRLASDRPGEARAKAHAILAAGPAPYEASVAHQAIGMLHREFGELDAATAELSAGVRLARACGSAEREADVLATLGVTLTYRGHSRRGLAALDRSLALVSGESAARVLVRRGITLWVLGRHAEALDDLGRSIRVLRAAGDSLFEARARSARALVHLARGSGHRAELDLARAEHLYTATSQAVEVAFTRHNRGLAAYRSGDLPAALACLDEAEHRYRQLAVPLLELATDRCAVLLAAGLPADALAEADAALGGPGRGGGRAARRAELLLASARAALAAGEPALAAARAQAAQRLFTAQGRRWWRTHAGLLLLQARCADHPPSARLLRQAGQVAADLDLLGSGDAAQARLLAGQLAGALGRHTDADAHLRAAARNRHRRVTALARAQGWLAEALRADAAGDRRRLLAACGRGLAILDEHQVTLGASELRAQATAHGAELAALAQRAALVTGRPRLMLSWSERWRATALAVPVVRPAVDPELRGSLAAFRAVTRRLENAESEGKPATTLRRVQRRLERTVRSRTLRAPGGTSSGAMFSPADLLDELGAARLIEIVEVDGTMYVLACGRGKVLQFTAGQAADAIRAADFARFALRRIARSRPEDDADSALAILAAAGPRLQQALLGPAVRQLGDGPLVIVPPGKLHAIPWALLPALRDRVVSVAPSAAAWLRARTAPGPERHNVILARGPGLASDGAEVPAVAGLYDDVTVLAGTEATAEKVLHELDGAWLAHVAAHGVFRADSPLFSSLRMHDGPLTVYDFEQLKQAPYRLILSSCEAGALAPAGADELLGLVSSLLPLGTAGIIAATLPLNDQAVVPVMTGLHRHLRAGRTLAEALCDVRREVAGDPVQHATAASLITLGAA